MRLFLVVSLVISLVFSWDLLCLVGKVNGEWLGGKAIEQQVSLRCEASRLKRNAVEVKKVGDLFIYKMKNGDELFCEEDWTWSFRWLAVVGRENFESSDCSVYY